MSNFSVRKEHFLKKRFLKVLFLVKIVKLPPSFIDYKVLRLYSLVFCHYRYTILMT